MSASDNTANQTAPASRYRALWDEGSGIPDVFEFLGQVSGTPLRQRAEVVFVDQYLRWQRGRPLDVVKYIEACPEIADDPRLKLELLTEEIGYREQFGKEAGVEQLIERYPDLEDELRAECHGRPVDNKQRGKRKPAPPSDSTDDVESTRPRENSEAAADRATAVPETVGRYVIERGLGAGAYGLVYLARDEQLHRSVAVKIPQSGRILNQHDVDTFLTEARNVAMLDHPGVVPVFDVGRTDDGRCYVVSRYIEGCDLAGLIGQSRPGMERSAEIVATVAEALHSAHRHGLVHRDVKPANVLIDHDGRPYVTDFGLALKDEDFGTGHGFAGTPAYMSPEQARGEGHRVDARSDIYSLGVILYELLTGRRPYHRDKSRDLLDQIRHAEPQPPRQLDDTIPRELERICLKALSKRVAERYSTAIDFAEDLRSFLRELATMATVTARSMSASAGSITGSLHSTTAGPDGRVGSLTSTDSDVDAALIRIVPKGMRSFDENDADFFLELLPGPRDRNGLPDSIRFWRQRLEHEDPDKTFPVGLVYGPSGCGKSSLMKAGVLPRLQESVRAVYAEATADGTESRLLRGLQKRLPGLPPDLNLAEAMAAIRRDREILPAGKMLLVIDQFEQWLHAWNHDESSLLIQALRHCDGGRVQCVVMVRDDFWMAATRFMMELEIRLVEGHNSAAVDLFDIRHATNVLEAYGRAYESVPSRASQVTKPQRAFLEQAVAGLARDGKVITVRLALFAEMVKDRPWTPATLRDIGGTQGVGVAFLEDAFGPTASPLRRYYAQPARAVLKTLLPGKGADIKGQLRTQREIMEASGLGGRRKHFEDLLQVLDNELRLITPSDPEPIGGIPDEGDKEPAGDRCYQLTHDYLVQPVRDWLTRKQRSTARGRAELRLDELATDWDRKPENRNLPSLSEYVRICALTAPGKWSGPETAMVRQANRYYALRGAILLILAVVLTWGGMEVRGRAAARSLHDRLLVARTGDVPTVIADLAGYRRWADPLLARTRDRLEADGDSDQSLRVGLALLAIDPRQVDYLCGRLVGASSPDEFTIILQALDGHRQQCVDRLWTDALSGPNRDGELLRIGAALARFDSADLRWRELSMPLAAELVKADPLELAHWRDSLRPVSDKLVEPLADIFLDLSEETSSERLVARMVLQQYATDNSELLARLIAGGSTRDSLVLMPLLERHKHRAVDVLQHVVNGPELPDWRDPMPEEDWSTPSDAVVRQIEDGRGLLDERFALCLAIDFNSLPAVIERLRPSGYRPVCVRPYPVGDRLFAAAVWARDELPWDWAYDLAAENISEQDRSRRESGLLPADIAGYVRDGNKYLIVWAWPTGRGSRSEFYFGELVEEEDSLTKPWVDGNLRAMRRQLFVDSSGVVRDSTIWGINARDTEETWSRQRSESVFKLLSLVRSFPLDVSVVLDDGSAGAAVRATYSGVWRRDVKHREAQLLQTGDVTEHLRECRSLVENGYRPVSASRAVIVPSESERCVSVWHRPLLSNEQIDAHLARRAAAGAALVRLGQATSVFPSLKGNHVPDLRSHLIHSFHRMECDPASLVNQLETELDVFIRQALILSLGEFGLDSMGASEQSKLTAKMLEWFRDDPDPGIHSAVQWCLNRWGKFDALHQFAQSESSPQPEDRRQWYRTPHGHTMAIVDLTQQAEPFLMGCPESEIGYGWWERPQLKNIRRKFAIASHEVTVDQFRQFVEAEPGVIYAFTEGSRGQTPQTRVSWYLAAQYCNWLSQQEGIPPDQWCYVPNENGKYAPGMTLAEDYLKRTGYRLPSETEWEYCCRAGTRSLRYFGQSERLLGEYAWYAANSANQTHDVGQLKPNSLGLFDMLGNAREWCQERYEGKLASDITRLMKDDYEDDLDVKDDELRLTRGGSFAMRPIDVRAAAREGDFPHIREEAIGFRVARTLDDVR